MAKRETADTKNIMGALAYLLGPITGLVLLVVEPKNTFVRFHAIQSIVLFGVLFILYVGLSLTLIGLILIPFLLIAQFVIWILLMWKAFNGELYAFPYIGDFAKKQVKRIS